MTPPTLITASLQQQVLFPYRELSPALLMVLCLMSQASVRSITSSSLSRYYSNDHHPLSSVTPTTNGNHCKIPYKNGANDVYFCVSGTCDTQNNAGISACKQGLPSSSKRSFHLLIHSNLSLHFKANLLYSL